MGLLLTALLLSAWAPHHVLVELDPAADGSMTDALLDAGGTTLEPLIPPSSPLAAGPLGRTWILFLDDRTDPVDAILSLAHAPGVVRASLDPKGRGADVIPDDPAFPEQWGLHNGDDTDINAPQAWERSTGGPILVAVIDTGVDGSHPQLAGFVEPGYDFVNDDDDPSDDHGHGTAIASVIAARGNDGTGLAGVCWSCRILAIKVLDRDNEGLYSWWVRGIDLAVTRGARIINLSIGGTGTSTDLETAVTTARDLGVVLVAAMMNDGDDTPFYPAAFEATIAVGATDESARRADRMSISGWASSHGPHHDLCAPGVLITSAALGSGTEPWSGTSLSVPFVAGAAALALTLDDTATPPEIRFGLRATATDGEGLPSEDTEGWDPYHGAGRLDMDLLLAAAEHGFVDEDLDGSPAGVDCDDSDPDRSTNCASDRGCGCNMVW